MTFDDIEIGAIYECQTGKRVAPLHIRDKIPTEDGGLVCQNLNTDRELFIKRSEVPRWVKSRINNMSEWRLHNGD